MAKFYGVPLIIVLLALILSPQLLVVDGTDVSNNHDLKLYSVMMGVKYPPSLTLPLRDLETALMSDEVVTLFTRGGFLNELYYTDGLGGYVHINFDEYIRGSGSNKSFIEKGTVLLHYSGYMVKTEISSHDHGRSIELTTTALQGEKTFVHTICASDIYGEVPEAVLQISMFPTPSSIIEYPGKGFVIEFGKGVAVFWLLDEGGFLNVSVTERDHLNVRVFFKNFTGTNCLRLIIVMARNLEEATKRLDLLKNTWTKLVQKSEDFLAELVKDFPSISVTTEEIRDLYYLALYLQLNSLTRTGASSDGIKMSALGLLNAAYMFPFTRSRVLKALILNEINEVIAQISKKGADMPPSEKISLLSTAALALYEYYKTSPEHVDTVKSIFSFLDRVLTSEEFDNTLKNISTPRHTVLAAQLFKNIYELSRLLNNEKPIYMAMYRKAVDRAESLLLNAGLHVHDIKAYNSTSIIKDYTLALALLSMLESSHRNELLDILAEIISGNDIQSLMEGSPYELCVAFIALARGGYADTVHDVLTDIMSKAKSGFLDRVPLCIGTVVLRGYLGLELIPQGLIIKPSIPTALNGTAAQIFVWDRKVNIFVKGYGNTVKRIIINNELLETPYISGEMLRTNEENFVFIEMQSPPKKLLLIRVLKGRTPLKGVMIRVIVNDSIVKRAYTDLEGEAIFIVPQEARIYVEAEYKGVKYGITTYVSKAEHNEVTITIPDYGEDKTQKELFSNITTIKNNVNELAEKLAELEKELKMLKENVSRLLTRETTTTDTSLSRGSRDFLLTATIFVILAVLSGLIVLYAKRIFKKVRRGESHSGNILKKLSSVGLIVLLFAYLLGSPAVFCDKTSLMTRQHQFSYTLTDWGGWVLQVYVQTSYPWIAGLEARIHVKVTVKEAVPNTTLTITKLTLNLRTLEVSSYVGRFSSVGESVDINLTLPLIDPEFAKIIPGESTTESAILTFEGYVEDNERKRSLYTSTLEVPVQITALPSALKVEIKAPEEVELGDYVLLEVIARNIGISELYSLTLSIYINKELSESKFVGTLPPGAVVRIFVPFKPAKEGIYTVLARANFTTPLNKVNAVINAVKLRVKKVFQLMIYVDALKAEVFDTVMIKGVTQPPIANLSLDLEMSSDGGASWNVISTCTTDLSGKCSFSWTPSNPGIYELRAHFIGSDIYFETFSNVIRITVSKRTPILRLEVGKNIVKVNEKVALRISMTPKISAKVRLEYRLLEENTWRKYVDVKLDENGQGTVEWIPLKPGTYAFRAVLGESSVLLGAVSNTITLKVTNYTQTPPKSTVTSLGQIQPPLPENIVRYIMVGVVVTSIAIGIAILFRWRRA
ncbi:MAG: hypothetical protein DRO12_03590 [Thermoprotei archaeon]|nr:MAG: hypothetical protein DRO12_03590 [Thermoprotei archaeon]